MAIDNEATFFAAGARRPELVNDGRTELKSKSAMRASKQASSKRSCQQEKQARPFQVSRGLLDINLRLWELFALIYLSGYH